MLDMEKTIGPEGTHDQIKEYIWKTLRAGRVVPGYVLFPVPHRLFKLITALTKLWPRSPAESRSAIHRPPGVRRYRT